MMEWFRYQLPREKSFSKDKRIEDCLMFDKYMGAEDDETFTNDSRKVR